MPEGSLTADQDSVNGTVTCAPLAGVSGLGASGAAALTLGLPSITTTTTARALSAAIRLTRLVMYCLPGTPKLGPAQRADPSARVGLRENPPSGSSVPPVPSGAATDLRRTTDKILVASPANTVSSAWRSRPARLGCCQEPGDHKLLCCQTASRLSGR